MKCIGLIIFKENFLFLNFIFFFIFENLLLTDLHISIIFCFNRKFTFFIPPNWTKIPQKGDNFFRFSKFSLQSLVTFWWQKKCFFVTKKLKILKNEKSCTLFGVFFSSLGGGDNKNKFQYMPRSYTSREIYLFLSINYFNNWTKNIYQQKINSGKSYG